MSASIDLGYLHLESTGGGLRIHLRSTAQLAPSGKDDIDELGTRLIEFSLSQDRDKLPYISSSENIAVVVRLQVDSELGDRVPTQDVTDQLASRLREAKLWGLMGFSTPCIQTSGDNASEHRIEMLLRHAAGPPEDATKWLKRRSHKLGIDLPNCDIRPPDGMLRANLDRVQLNLVITALHKELVQETAADSTRALEEPPRQVPVDYDDELLLEMVEDRSDDGDELILDAEEGMLPYHHSACNVNEPATVDMHSYWNSNDYYHGREPLGTTTIVEHNDTPSPPPRASDDVYAVADAHVCGAEKLTGLVLMCLNTAIGGPIRERKDDPVVSAKNIHSLASFAPCIWSPRYLASIADRSVFLPTLSHALSTLICNTERGALGRKGAKITETTACRDDIAREPGCVKVSSQERVSQSMHERLWNILQARVYSLHTAESTKVLLVPDAAVSVDLDSSLDILEPGQGGSMSYDPRGVDDEAQLFAPDDDDTSSEHDLLEICDYTFTQRDEDDHLAHMQQCHTTNAEDESRKDQRPTPMISVDCDGAEALWRENKAQEASSDDPLCTAADEDEDMWSICSSVEVLSLQYYDDLDGTDKYRGRDTEQMLCI